VGFSRKIADTYPNSLAVVSACGKPEVNGSVSSGNGGVLALGVHANRLLGDFQLEGKEKFNEGCLVIPTALQKRKRKNEARQEMLTDWAITAKSS